EVDEAIRCFIDDENPTECDSRGYATTPGCEDEAFAMGECLWLGGTEGVEDVAQCTALNSGCHSCCEDAFPGGADEWNDVVEACACSDSCASSCDGVCGDPEAVITEACS